MIEYLRQLNFLSMTLRIIIAAFVGGLIGIEREKKGRGAGFRTYIIVAVGSSMTIILSQYLDLMLNTQWADISIQVGIKTDVSRFGAQVINGVGFLGAGTVLITSRQSVKGLTTAAGLWASACLGLAVGAGFYECVIICAVMIYLIMKVFPYFEYAVLTKSKFINLSVDMESMDKLSNLLSAIKSKNIHIFDIDVDKNIIAHNNRIIVYLNLLLPERQVHESVVADLSSVDGVLSIDEV